MKIFSARKYLVRGNWYGHFVTGGRRTYSGGNDAVVLVMISDLINFLYSTLCSIVREQFVKKSSQNE